jgi:hypothetical protein
MYSVKTKPSATSSTINPAWPVSVREVCAQPPGFWHGNHPVIGAVFHGTISAKIGANETCRGLTGCLQENAMLWEMFYKMNRWYSSSVNGYPAYHRSSKCSHTLLGSLTVPWCSAPAVLTYNCIYFLNSIWCVVWPILSTIRPSLYSLLPQNNHRIRAFHCRHPVF